MDVKNISKTWVAAIVAVFFLVLAVGGAALTSRKMNVDASMSGSSSGRAGDPRPNALQEQQTDKSARGAPRPEDATTSGSGAPAGDAARTTPSTSPADTPNTT